MTLKLKTWDAVAFKHKGELRVGFIDNVENNFVSIWYKSHKDVFQRPAFKGAKLVGTVLRGQKIENACIVKIGIMPIEWRKDLHE